MGMSASQARLLSITARLTDNEMSSQLITNSKLRLADKSSEASSEYMKALNSSQLMYYSYDESGNRSTQSLTAASLTNYGDLKNQYGLINTSGQIMVSSTDRANYESSATMAQFMEKSGIPKADNPEYPKALINIYGEDYHDVHNEENVLQWQNYLNGITGDGMSNLYAITAKDPKNMSQDDIDTFMTTIAGWRTQISANPVIGNYEDLSGVFGVYVNKLLSEPELGTFPDRGDDQFWDTGGNSQLAKDFKDASGRCYNHAMNRDLECYLHVLGHLIDLKKSDVNKGSVSSSYAKYQTTTLGDHYTVTATYINDSAIHNDGDTIKMAAVSEYLYNPDNYCRAPKDPNDTTNINSSKLSKLLSNYKFVTKEDGTVEKVQKTFPEKVVDLFYVVNNNNNAAALGGERISAEALVPYLEQFQSIMEKELSSVFVEQRYMDAIEELQNTMKAWIDSVQTVKLSYEDKINNLPPIEVTDAKHPKYEWYKNLWYRMGGISETRKDDTANNYKELDSTKMNNAECLQFALEQGILTLEKVNATEDGSEKYPNIGNCDWISIQYNNSADITSQQNETAITKAEVKYKEALSEIEQKDKKFDQDLKKLDSLHNALQTEYDSLKGIIEKNVERSFKAFS